MSSSDLNTVMKEDKDIRTGWRLKDTRDMTTKCSL